MNSTTKLAITMTLALLLGACKSMSGLWGEEKQEPAPAPEARPVATQAAPQPSLYDKIESDIAANRLSKPSGNNAIEKIEQLRQQNPQDPAIAGYEKQVINRYLDLADRRLKRSTNPSRPDLETALSYINTARSLHVASPELDKKEEEIIELLDIVIQKEQLEKARAAAKDKAEKAVEVATEKAEEVSDTATEQVQQVVETATTTVSGIKPNPQINNPNFLSLTQADITARSQDINLQLDSISPIIVERNASVVIHAQSMDDFRYLSASLRTSLYWVNPDYNVTADPHIDASVSPGIEIVAGN